MLVYVTMKKVNIVTSRFSDELIYLHYPLRCYCTIIVAN